MSPAHFENIPVTELICSNKGFSWPCLRPVVVSINFTVSQSVFLISPFLSRIISPFLSTQNSTLVTFSFCSGMQRKKVDEVVIPTRQHGPVYVPNGSTL